MSSSSSADDSIRPDMLVLRPPDEYMKLTVPTRWEVIRRHPYYQRWWQVSGQDVPANDINLQRLQRVTRFILYSTIQVENYWPDPATPYASIGSHPGLQPFQGGTLSPLIRRAHLLHLSLGLDWATFANILQAMIPMIRHLEREDDGRFDLAKAIHDLDYERLNEVSNNCIFSFNPHAPIDAILRDFRQLVRRVKRERRIRETRRRPEKVNEYLQVWDAREGWNCGSYDRGQERSLREIAQRFRRPLKTVSDQYRSAFRLIVGHPYTPELWVKVVAVWKWRESNIQVNSRLVHRPLHGRTIRDVPVSRIVAHTNNAVFLEGAGVTSAELAASSLLQDIRDRIRAGDDNSTIYDTLDLSSNSRSLGLVEYIRLHINELNSR